MDFKSIRRPNQLQYQQNVIFVAKDIPQPLPIPAQRPYSNVRAYVQEPCHFVEKKIPQLCPVPRTISINKVIHW